MNRVEFMEQLDRLLQDISEAERQEALEYYESYFDEAGPENVDKVIRELGSPGKVAAIIKADLQGSSEEYASYTERGYEDAREEKDIQRPVKYGTGDSRSAKIILGIIALVFLAPLLTGALGGVAGVVVTILLLPFILVIAFGGAAVGLIIGGAACLISGIGLCTVTFGRGILTVGIGCILIAVGIIFLVLTTYLSRRVLPGILRKVTDCCYRFISKIRKRGEAR